MGIASRLLCVCVCVCASFGCDACCLRVDGICCDPLPVLDVVLLALALPSLDRLLVCDDWS